MANETAQLADFVATLTYDAIPPEVAARAKSLTLDFLGSAVRARKEAESTPALLAMLKALSLDGDGIASVGRSGRGAETLFEHAQAFGEVFDGDRFGGLRRSGQRGEQFAFLVRQLSEQVE